MSADTVVLWCRHKWVPLVVPIWMRSDHTSEVCELCGRERHTFFTNFASRRDASDSPVREGERTE